MSKRTRTAADAASEHLAEIHRLLDKVRAKADQDCALFQSLGARSWAVVGTLSHTREILAHLAGEGE